MRTLATAALFALALQGCSNDAESESADDFAARVGAGDQAAAPVDPAAQESVPTQAAPPAGTDMRNLEQLGNIAGADLGPRDGGCTFMAGTVELLMAGAPNDPASSGKAVIRVGGKLYVLGAPAGGLAAIQNGTRFSGSGVSIDVAATNPQAATLTVSAVSQAPRTIAGSWVCA